MDDLDARTARYKAMVARWIREDKKQGVTYYPRYPARKKKQPSIDRALVDCALVVSALLLAIVIVAR